MYRWTNGSTASAPAAGHWGTDCALSYGPDGKVAVLAGTGYKPLSSAPLFYVYELPPEYNTRWVYVLVAGMRAYS